MRRTLSFIPRFLHGSLLRAARHVRARYDAAWQSVFRSQVPMPVQSAARDVGADRFNLMALSRRWDQNSPLVHGLLERLCTYTVGTGLNPVPASASKRFNGKVTRLWEDWARRPEVTDRFSWGTLQRILWRCALRDGDSFLLLTNRDDNSPAVQMIEGHRIAEPTMHSTSSLLLGDGVIRDRVGKHVGYKLIREDDGSPDGPPLAGDAVVQILLPERPDQPRGITLFAAALKTIHNLDDILRLEQLAVKDAAGRVDIIKMGNGALPMEDVVRLNPEDQPPVAQDPYGYYTNVFNPESKVIRPGDDWTAYEPKRPGPAWQGFVEYLTNTIALSTGMPPSVLVVGKLGGADTRKDLAAAARVLEAWQWMQADAYQRVYEFVVGSWIDQGVLGNAPKDWRRTNWQMPRSITADAGRIAQADIDLVASGMLSLEDYFGENGWGPQKIEQIAKEQELVNELDPSGMLAARLYSKPGAAPAAPEEKPADDQGEDDPPKQDDEGDNSNDQQDEPGPA